MGNLDTRNESEAAGGANLNKNMLMFQVLIGMFCSWIIREKKKYYSKIGALKNMINRSEWYEVVH